MAGGRQNKSAIFLDGYLLVDDCFLFPIQSDARQNSTSSAKGGEDPFLHVQIETTEVTKVAMILKIND